MRGEDERSGSLFSYVDLEARVGETHPLRAIGMIVNEALAALAGDFAARYSRLGLDIESSRSSVGFTWEGFDEMDEVSGDGSAELLDDGSIEIEFAYHNGDEGVLKAKRENSSTAC